MAIRYGYFDSEVTGVDENGMPVFDRAETSDLFRLLFANLVSSGVLATPGDCFKVNADTGLTVRIRPGFAMINGAFAYDAEESTVTLATANANLPRIDRVVLRCNYLNRLCEIITKTGTPASTPAAPELLQPASGDYYELCLATIRVEAGVTSITQSAITDTRGDSSVCGFITQLIDHLDTSEFMSQLTTWQEEYAAEQQAAFSTWFEDMKDQLSEDAAGNLQRQIDNLTQSVETDIGQINETIGGADMGTSDPTIKGAVREIVDRLDSGALALNDKIIVEQALNVDISLAARGSHNRSYDISKPGYKAKSISSWMISGLGWDVVNVRYLYLDPVYDLLRVVMTNYNTSAYTVRLAVNIEYVKIDS